jgi:hypothetical protein
MPSLTTCLTKAGKLIDPTDKAAIMARARELAAAGSKRSEAAAQAAQEQLDRVLSDMDARGKPTKENDGRSAAETQAPGSEAPAAEGSDGATRAAGDPAAGSAAVEADGVTPLASQAAQTEAASPSIVAKQSDTNTPGVDPATLRARIADIRSGWKNAPPITVADTVADLPADIRKALADLGATDNVRALVMPDTGQVYVIANRTESMAEAEFAIGHEVLGHFGLRTVLDPMMLNREMNRIKAANPALKKEADAWFAKFGAKQIEGRIERGMEAGAAAREVQALAVEEALSDRAADAGPLNGWQEFIARLQAALRKIGFDGTADWLEQATQAETLALLARARDAVVKGRAVSASAGVDSNAVLASQTAQTDPSSPSILLSQKDAPLIDRLTSSLTRENIRQGIADRMQPSVKGFNWWHRTIGTQYHKAKTNKRFGRVFRSAQAYIDDTAFFANTAADQAPNLLPKLDRLADVRKRLSLSPADEAAVSKAVFTGTLDDRVYSEAELRADFDLNDRQIGLYNEFRAAVGLSLDQLVSGEIIRYLGTNIDDMPAGLPQLVSDGQLDRFRSVVTKAIGETLAGHTAQLRALKGREPAQTQPVQNLVDLWTKIREDVADKYSQIEKLKKDGYAPLMRFGRYTVDVTDGVGDAPERIYFGMYETEAEAVAAARRLQAENPQAQVKRGIVSQEDYKLFKGLNPATLEIFGESSGIDEALMQQFIKVAVSNRSALKRKLKRSGVAGFSEEASRVLAAFVTSNARSAAGGVHLGELDHAINDIPKAMGDVRDEAVNLREYVQNPTEEAQALRGLLFVSFLGGSVASAAVNLTQPITMTLPWMTQHMGAMKAGRMIGAAMKDSMRQVTDPALAAAMKKAEDRGIVSPQSVHQLQAEISRTLANKPAARKALFLWGSMFSLAEQFNRRTTFIAAWRHARDIGHVDPMAFAETAVEETQGIYSKAARPNWARGAVGSTLFTFKQYSISYLEMFSRMLNAGEPGSERRAAGRKGALMMMAVLVMLSGIDGLPFADDLDDLIDTVGQRLGYATNAKEWRDEALREFLGDQLADLAQRGAATALPLDFSGRLGMGNLIPATGAMRMDQKDASYEIAEALGPIGGFAKGVAGVAGAALSGDAAGAAKALPVVAIKNLMQAGDMVATGQYRDTKGRKVVDATFSDAVIKAIGFQPQTVATEQREIGMNQQDINLARNVEASIAQTWADGIVEQDTDKVAKARDRLATWNEKNPDTPIRITPDQVRRRAREMRKSKAERQMRAAPKELRPALAQ